MKVLAVIASHEPSKRTYDSLLAQTLQPAKIPWAAEIHRQAKADASGTFPYIRAVGYRKSSN